MGDFADALAGFNGLSGIKAQQMAAYQNAMCLQQQAQGSLMSPTYSGLAWGDTGSSSISQVVYYDASSHGYKCGPQLQSAKLPNRQEYADGSEQRWLDRRVNEMRVAL